ncbi:AAA family ATPase [Frankia sp. Mgl5]|uniref:HelD family protein n=1 Tax=Frankia sp. Mgl5 TaxID=2933793 RepID=UPI0020109E0F|nr:AAA family ATPase [Frankia sp. Mgl5]MCK9929485.1 AAA family ATPase [Frankia sp. Mgl5]
MGDGAAEGRDEDPRSVDVRPADLRPADARSVDPWSAELAAERRHLDRARAALVRMRHEAEATEIAEGDPVADKVTNASLKAARRRRLEALSDPASGAPLFFGRIDYAAGAAAAPGRRVHLGRRHVREAAGDDPLVVDWRTDIARPYYRAYRGDTMGLVARRRFGFDGPELTAFEEEPLVEPSPGPAGASRAGGPAGGDLLAREIARPRSGPMRDIVATIQPEQDEIVRADLEVSVCVQGAPGTGKTAVGLHRAAYLLFAYRERLSRAGVLVVGPNRAFLRYIGAVLPALGEFTVTHRSLAALVDVATARGTDPEPVAEIKGDARMAVVIRRALGATRPDASPPAALITSSLGRWTVSGDEIAGLAAGIQAGGHRHRVARDLLARRIAAAVVRRAEERGHLPADSAVERLARTRSVRAAVDAVWPRTDAAGLIHRLFTDPALLAHAADGVLSAPEQRLLLADRPTSRRAVRWSPADLFCLDEALDLIDGVPAFGHVIVDEAQDLSAMQCRAVGRRCATGSLTVLGDLAQGTTAWATRSWEQALAHFGKPAARLEVLTRGHRVPAEILSFADRLLPSIAPDLPPASSTRAVPGALRVIAAPLDDLAGEAARQVRAGLGRGGSVAVIAPDEAVGGLTASLRAAGLPAAALTDDAALTEDAALTVDAEPADEAVLTGDAEPTEGVSLTDKPVPEGRASRPVTVVPASLAKGLEFDHVVLVDPASVAGSGPGSVQGLRRLYVVLTRAVTSLAVIHAGELPSALADPGGPFPRVPRPGGAGRPDPALVRGLEVAPESA